MLLNATFFEMWGRIYCKGTNYQMCARMKNDLNLILTHTHRHNRMWAFSDRKAVIKHKNEYNNYAENIFDLSS